MGGVGTGGLERSMPLLLSSSSSASLQSAPDRRSLIGNEPWSHTLSWDQQIATTYRLWRGDSSLFHLHLYIALLSPPLSSSLSPHVYGEFMIYQRQCRGQGHREMSFILLLLICQTAHVLYSNLAWSEMPVLTNPPGVATFIPLYCRLLPYFSKWAGVKENHLQIMAI